MHLRESEHKSNRHIVDFIVDQRVGELEGGCNES